MGVAREAVLRLPLPLEAFNFWGLPGNSEISKSALSQARTRVGWEVMAKLVEECLTPIAQPHTQGAWFQGLRVVSVDDSTLDLPYEAASELAFRRPSAWPGNAAYPQLRFVGLPEGGTHVMFATALGPMPTARRACLSSSSTVSSPTWFVWLTDSYWATS